MNDEDASLNSDITIPKCLDSCYFHYVPHYAGITNGTQCWCSSDLNADKVDANECNVPCNGSDSTMCGGRHPQDLADSAP